MWGIYDKTILTSGKKTKLKKTHIFFCKNTLGVNKQCPNVAARNELSRLPLKLAIETAIIKFWIHLQNFPDKNIAKQCLQLSKEMAEKEHPGLTQKIKTMCNKYSSAPITLNENNEKVFICHIKPRENEVRERIPVPHDNYLESIISSRPHCKGYFCLLFP